MVDHIYDSNTIGMNHSWHDAMVCHGPQHRQGDDLRWEYDHADEGCYEGSGWVQYYHENQEGTEGYLSSWSTFLCSWIVHRQI